jgi:hypothetical protein
MHQNIRASGVGTAVVPSLKAGHHRKLTASAVPVVCASARQSTAAPDSLRQRSGVSDPLREPPGNGLTQAQHILQRRQGINGASVHNGANANGSGPTPGVQPDGSQLLVPGLANLDDFVSHLRNASPYIEGHRGCTFVIVIPGEVCHRAAGCHAACSQPAIAHLLETPSDTRLWSVIGHSRADLTCCEDKQLHGVCRCWSASTC